MTLLKREERACYLKHHKLAYLKKQKICKSAILPITRSKTCNLYIAIGSKNHELTQESYLVFAFEIFASLYVAKLAHFFKHFASLYFVKEAKIALLKREERTYYLEHHKNLLPCMM